MTYTSIGQSSSTNNPGSSKTTFRLRHDGYARHARFESKALAAQLLYEKDQSWFHRILLNSERLNPREWFIGDGGEPAYCSPDMNHRDYCPSSNVAHDEMGLYGIESMTKHCMDNLHLY